MTSKYKLRITGKRVEYFISQLISNKINIYKIEKDDNSYIIIVDDLGLDSIRKMKTSYKFKIIGYYGIARIKYLLNKYSIINT